MNRKFLGEEGAFALRGWIKQAVASNMPYDQFVYTVLTASGSTLENPPAAYFKVLRTPEETMENTTQLFLGVRFNCNQCHDHPFERWTQDQYYHLAAYLRPGRPQGRSGRPGETLGGTAVEGGKPLVEVIYDTGSGEVTHGGTGQPAAPDFPLCTRGRGRQRRLAPRTTGPLDHLEGQPVLRQELRQSPVGLSVRHAASSSRSTTFAPAIRRPIPSCSTA